MEGGERKARSADFLCNFPSDKEGVNHSLVWSMRQKGCTGKSRNGFLVEADSLQADFRKRQTPVCCHSTENMPSPAKKAVIALTEHEKIGTEHDKTRIFLRNNTN